MRQKLNKILLIDDSDADNFIHKRVIKKAAIAHEIVVKNGGQIALDYLASKDEAGNYPTPELVFLDINMPGMNGWEFLERYDKLPNEQKAGVIVCMLTTSVAETDREKASHFTDIESFLNKPLTDELLRKLLEKFFPQLMN